MITKVSDIRPLVKRGIENPKKAFGEIKKLAASKDWKVREVAATALVEISKKKSEEVIKEAFRWAKNKDENIRRAASEGLRDIARKNPEKVLPVIEELKSDKNLYVKKSVANILRNASRKSLDFTFRVCQKWAKLKNPDTNWIIKAGMKKLSKEQQDKLKSLIS